MRFRNLFVRLFTLLLLLVFIPLISGFMIDVLLLASVSQMQQRVWLILAVTILTVAVSALIFSKRIYTFLLPLEKSNISTSSCNNLKDLNLYIKELIKQNRSMNQQLQMQQNNLENSFINNIIYGYINKNNIDEYQHSLKIPDGENRYTVVSCSFLATENLQNIKILKELDSLKVLIKSIINSQYPYKSWFLDHSNSSLTIIFQSPGDSVHDLTESVKTILNDVIETSKRHYPPGLSIGIGRPQNSIALLHRSFNEALEAENYFRKNLIFMLETRSDYIQYNEIEKKLDYYYYPIEMEMQLMNGVNAGDHDLVQSLLQKLESENFSNRSVPNETLLFLIYEIKSTLVKLVNQSELQTKDYLIPEQGEPVSQFHEISKGLVALTTLNEKSKKSHNHELVEKILKYINRYYRDPGMSLTRVAEQFSLSESYISYFLKEQTGENFSHILERLRIQKAMNLLKSSDDSVHKISQSIGYGSDKSFRRVFKKVNAMSPSEYRNKD